MCIGEKTPVSPPLTRESATATSILCASLVPWGQTLRKESTSIMIWLKDFRDFDAVEEGAGVTVDIARGQVRNMLL